MSEGGEFAGYLIGILVTGLLSLVAIIISTKGSGKNTELTNTVQATKDASEATNRLVDQLQEELNRAKQDAIDAKVEADRLREDNRFLRSENSSLLQLVASHQRSIERLTQEVEELTRRANDPEAT